MAISYLAMAEKTDNTTRCTASEYNEIKDALTDGTKSITCQGIKLKSASYTEDGALNVGGFASIDTSSGTCTMTLAAPPEAGVFQVINLTDATNNAIVTVGSGVTIDGSKNTMTFDTANDSIVMISLTTTRWLIIVNNGVILSSV